MLLNFLIYNKNGEYYLVICLLDFFSHLFDHRFQLLAICLLDFFLICLCDAKRVKPIAYFVGFCSEFILFNDL